ncbi:MAG: DUF255 domain-containing protein [Phycisphaerales bacterium]
MNRCVHSASVLAVAVFGSGCAAQSPDPAAQPATKVVQPAGAAPASQPEKKRLYDESADAKQQIARALKAAKKNNRRVLIQWGGNWCGWCIKLHELCTRNADIKSTLQYEYDVVHIDTGGRDDKNMALAKSYGADITGFPYLTILDADGKPVVNQGTEPLELKAEPGKEPVMGHDPRLVLDFLKKHQAPYQNASEVLDAGMKQAAQEGKIVFLHFGAPWCGWCHRLEDWMDRPEVASIMSKHFVDVKIDTDRNVGGKDALATYAGTDKVGIPWFVLLSADGKPIADAYASDAQGKKSNVGFPAAPEEIAHFEAMLKKTGKLTASEISSLIESLRGDKPKDGAGH